VNLCQPVFIEAKDGLAYLKLTWGSSNCLWPLIAPGYLGEVYHASHQPSDASKMSRVKGISSLSAPCCVREDNLHSTDFLETPRHFCCRVWTELELFRVICCRAGSYFICKCIKTMQDWDVATIDHWSKKVVCTVQYQLPGGWRLMTLSDVRCL